MPCSDLRAPITSVHQATPFASALNGETTRRPSGSRCAAEASASVAIAFASSRGSSVFSEVMSGISMILNAGSTERAAAISRLERSQFLPESESRSRVKPSMPAARAVRTSCWRLAYSQSPLFGATGSGRSRNRPPYLPCFPLSPSGSR